MKILGIEHLGVARNKTDDFALFWNVILGLKHTGTDTVETQGVITDIYDTGCGKVELLEATNQDSPIARFLDKRGPGIHHVCFEVDDITEAIKELKENDITVIGENYTIGAEGYKVIFIHPRETGGVLIELAEKP